MTTASPAVRQTAALAWRSIVTTVRLPQAWFPALFFPLVLMAIFTASFGGAPGVVPGFPPVRGFLDFAVCGAIVQGVLIAGTSAGAAFATDIEGGFFDRLVASPTSRVAILTGRLGASMALGLFQAVLFIAIAWICGARVQGGVTGVIVVVVIAVLFAAAVGGLGVFLALRTGSGEAVQGMFPLFFALLFFSSAFFPIETMTGWSSFQPWPAPTPSATWWRPCAWRSSGAPPSGPLSRASASPWGLASSPSGHRRWPSGAG